MSSEMFERNLGRLVRRAALPADDAARTRARAEFLRAAEAGSPSRSRGLAVAAAAILAGALVTVATRGVPPVPPGPTPSLGRQSQEPPLRFAVIPGRGGDEVLKGVLKAAKGTGPTRTFRFEGRCSLPDGVGFHVLVRRAEQRFVLGRLEEEPLALHSFSLPLVQGAFTCEWPLSSPGRLTLQVSAPDNDQEMSVLEALKRIPESARSWSFEYDLGDDALLARIDPQLGELEDLVREARDLIARVEQACNSPERFKASEKALTADARRLEARANGFADTGLIPAGAREVARTAADLASSMGIFTWTDGKFAGPVSYYTNGKRGKTHRGDEFDFPALRRHLDDAVLIAGREADLWFAADGIRAGLRPALIEAVERSAKRRGVAEFAPRLKSVVADAELIESIRRISE